MGRTALHLLLALTILVSVFLRPPGTMLVMRGDTITYTLCSGSDAKTVTVALDGQDSQEIDLGCDFFAAQIAALIASVPDVGFSIVELAYRPAFKAETHAITSIPWSNYASRAPPVPELNSHT